MHLSIAAPPGILRRRWRFDDRRINQRAFLHHQSTFAQRDTDLVEQLPSQLVLDQQAPEFQQRGRIRHILDGQITAGEGAQRNGSKFNRRGHHERDTRFSSVNTAATKRGSTSPPRVWEVTLKVTLIRRGFRSAANINGSLESLYELFRSGGPCPRSPRPCFGMKQECC